jgi:hypothetical protein
MNKYPNIILFATHHMETWKTMPFWGMWIFKNIFGYH